MTDINCRSEVISDGRCNWLSTLIRLAIAASLTLWPIAATAQGVAIAPTTIVLAPSHRTEMLTLRNQSPEENRFQASAYQWEQTTDGREVLHPTEDLIVFPSLFSVKPGEQQIIRVGSSTPFEFKEKSYRLFIEQLPSLESPNRTTQSAVKLLMRMGLPVFLQPAHIVAGAAISAAEVKDGSMQFTLENTGNVHLVASEVQVTGKSRGNHIVFERTARPSYVPAASSLNFVLPIQRSDCSQTQVFAIRIMIEQKAPGRDTETKRSELTRTLDPGSASCGK